jgi:hypothetical protein
VNTWKKVHDYPGAEVDGDGELGTIWWQCEGDDACKMTYFKQSSSMKS